MALAFNGDWGRKLWSMIMIAYRAEEKVAARTCRWYEENREWDIAFRYETKRRYAENLQRGRGEEWKATNGIHLRFLARNQFASRRSKQDPAPDLVMEIHFSRTNGSDHQQIAIGGFITTVGRASDELVLWFSCNWSCGWHFQAMFDQHLSDIKVHPATVMVEWGNTVVASTSMKSQQASVT
ncbi:hypothetical protein MRB53_024572 [Persea americana]|uniref:Uncharacterized protein n=1 Tax=Persea americana TaxID=3435 RepID=A0ACC2LCT3_PERAE|nr:hypothetical protein MRB53_024572 [Persea americana]